MSDLLKLEGTLMCQPSIGSSELSSDSWVGNLALTQQQKIVNDKLTQRVTISSTEGSPFVVDFGSITKGFLLYLQCSTKMGYILNSNTEINYFQGTLLVEFPADEPLTALKLIGSGVVKIGIFES